ncbi:translational GTPase TypA [Candidatus Nomurabacteria bacterium]|nr:translational GTPase TypA [Candidatus Nomurabacteria bacterium]
MKIRNVAIIAHVDHGKTTLVDALLRQSKTKISKETVEKGDLIMDSNDLERERGITIFSKNASVNWDGVKINIIDTPGHADFGGEVERVLKMADGALLLVDAKEGPMPQTRFVLKKALNLGLKVIVVVNKIDKPGSRPDWALEETLGLFLDLGANDEQADFPVLYASGRAGVAGVTPKLEEMKDIAPVFDTILKEIKAPEGDVDGSLQMLVTTVFADEWKGRIATGRIYRGTIRAGQEVAHINREGLVSKERLVSLMTFDGLGRIETAEAQVGDIVAIAGLPDVTIGETIADIANPEALPLLSIEEPTVKVTFLPNDSPWAGREGQFTTSRELRERLYKELENDMALRVDDIAGGKGWIVSGRGELHLAILIERLRREGYELQVSRPQVITKVENGVEVVPFEEVFVETPEAYSGVVIEKMGKRHGQMADFRLENGIAHLKFTIPTRGLFGYRNEFLTDTKGLGIMNTLFLDYREDKQTWSEKERGSLVASDAGQTLLYSLVSLQERGTLFYGPGAQVYVGQVVGEHSRSGDLRVNPCKAKQLSNMRSKGDGGTEHFDKPHTMNLEEALEYIGGDELVEVTPKNVRIRKIILDEAEARRLARGIKN